VISIKPRLVNNYQIYYQTEEKMMAPSPIYILYNNFI